MRFTIDVAFVTWPPAPDCEIVAAEVNVAPLRIVAPGGLPRGQVAVLEAPSLQALGVVPGARLSVESGQGFSVGERGSG
jgi:hypothetical protein